MSNTTTNALSLYIERARKVLQHEQRTNHQDQAIKPGGLEMFVVRWADEASTACKNAGLDLHPIHHFTEHLQGYRKQDPMQRAASLRAALATLNELEASTNGQNDKQHSTPSPVQPVRTQKIESKPIPSEAQAQTAQPAHPDNKTEAATPSKPAIVPGAKPLAKADNKEASAPAQNPIHLEAGMSAGHTVLTLLSADVTAVPGVGPSVATRLRSLGIKTIRDLLFYFPREHRDYSKLEKIANIPFNEVTTTMGLIWEVESARTSSGRSRTIVTISDETGKIKVTWFNQPYLTKQLNAAKGSYLVVTGVKQRFGNKIEFSVRSHELPEQGDLLNTGRLVPTYPLTEGLHAKTLRRFTKWVVDRYAAMVPDYLPAAIRSAGKLMPLPDAISHIHYPENETALLNAHRRLGFDERFLIQLGMQERRSRWQQEAPHGNAFNIDLTKIFVDPPTRETIVQQEKSSKTNGVGENKDVYSPPNTTLWSPVITDKPFEATLPFRFTDAQQRVICEILADLAQSKPMCRLLQGDVGAGKTAVAAAALLTAALNGYQGAIMAPTELLAEQHARSISAMLEPFGIHTVLLTGSLKQ